MLITAIVFINLALIFYTIGVWGEKLSGSLKRKHLLFFYLGLVCDTLGTSFMEKLLGSIQLNIHSITGFLALFLMLVHAIWATVVLVKKNERGIKDFHKFSLFVWILWLIPYGIGVLLNVL